MCPPSCGVVCDYVSLHVSAVMWGMSYSKYRAIVISVVQLNMSVTETAARYGYSTRHVRRILARYREEGLEGLTPRSKAPHSHPHATSEHMIQQVLALRDQLQAQGLDCGPVSIHTRLTGEHIPSVSTIWRILRNHNRIEPQPHKRPRSSYQRFQASMANETWQSDFTHYPLADGTDVEIISWMDDYSRYLLIAQAHPRVSVHTVIDTFTTCAYQYGLPASILTDNGMVYTTRLASGNRHNHQPNAFEQLLAHYSITAKHGKPGHPTTQGKIERYHQTLKQWLNAQPAANTIDELNKLLQDFQHLYNHQRPHRALNLQTPAHAYKTSDKDSPHYTEDNTVYRVRIDKVDQHGKVSLRYLERMLHFGVGRAHNHQPVILLIAGTHVQILHQTTAEILGEYNIDLTKNYQKKRHIGRKVLLASVWC